MFTSENKVALLREFQESLKKRYHPGLAFNYSVNTPQSHHSTYNLFADAAMFLNAKVSTSNVKGIVYKLYKTVQLSIFASLAGMMQLNGKKSSRKKGIHHL